MVVPNDEERAAEILFWLTKLSAAPGHTIMSTRAGGFEGRTLDLADLDACAQAVLEASKGSDTYLRATTTRIPPAKGRRGGASDTEAVFGLWADLDHALGIHQPPVNGLPLPAGIDECLAIISPLPEPTYIIDTGGGLQVWWFFEAPVRLAERPDLADIIKRWGRLMVDLGEQAGRHVDMVGDLPRILRMPGTLNHKWADRDLGPVVPVTIRELTRAKYTVDELVAFLPAEEPRATSSGTRTTAGDDHDDIAAWEAENDWGDILEPHGWTLHRQLALGVREWTRPGDAHTSRRSAVTDFAGAPTMVVFSAAAGLPSGGGQKLTKFRVWAHLEHGGDVKAASKAIRETHGAPHRATKAPKRAVRVDEEDAFWRAHPTLDHIRTFARARMASPWAALGIVLTRVVCCQPPELVLPPTIGGVASLNLFLAIVADPGGGKGAAEAVARDCLVYPEDTYTTGIGSGEGILHQYVRWVPPNKQEGREEGEYEQHRQSVLFTATEVDTLAALHARKASTLLPEIRKMWMGEALSFGYVDPKKAVRVDAHHYRAGLVVGVQPARGDVLLDDADGGTPQRFVWLPAADVDIPDIAPGAPEPLALAEPLGQYVGTYRHIVLPVCDEAIATIEDAHRRRNRGDGDALDGHALLCRLKVAAALGLLLDEGCVSVRSWHLSETVMRVSDHTRGRVRARLAEHRANVNRQRASEYAEREVVKEAAIEEDMVRRVCAAIMRALGRSPLPHAELRRTITSKSRGAFDAAVTALVATGQIKVVDNGRGTVYSTNS